MQMILAIIIIAKINIKCYSEFYMCSCFLCADESWACLVKENVKVKYVISNVLPQKPL